MEEYIEDLLIKCLMIDIIVLTILTTCVLLLLLAINERLLNWLEEGDA